MTPTSCDPLGTYFDSEAAGLETVLAYPLDDGPRLIMTDWWDEHGQCELAEFVRGQIALADWSCHWDAGKFKHDKRCCKFDNTHHSTCEFQCPAVTARCAALLAEHPANCEVCDGNDDRCFVRDAWGNRTELCPAVNERHWLTLLGVGDVPWAKCNGSAGNHDDVKFCSVCRNTGERSPVCWHRGFPAEVELTTAAFIDKPCKECGDDGKFERGKCVRKCVNGLIPGLAGKLGCLPLTQIRISDLRPLEVDGEFSFIPRQHEPESAWFTPPELWDLIAQQECSPYETGIVLKMFDSAALAHSALSAACVTYSRQRACAERRVSRGTASVWEMTELWDKGGRECSI